MQKLPPLPEGTPATHRRSVIASVSPRFTPLSPAPIVRKSSPPSVTDRAIRALVDLIKFNPLAMTKVADKESLILFQILLDESTGRDFELEHLLRCVIVIKDYDRFNELVNWANQNHYLASLTVVTFRILGRGKNGANLRKLILDPRCAQATMLLSGQVN